MTFQKTWSSSSCVQARSIPVFWDYTFYSTIFLLMVYQESHHLRIWETWLKFLSLLCDQTGSCIHEAFIKLGKARYTFGLLMEFFPPQTAEIKNQCRRWMLTLDAGRTYPEDSSVLQASQALPDSMWASILRWGWAVWKELSLFLPSDDHWICLFVLNMWNSSQDSISISIWSQSAWA